ncbi:MAG: hypothetical protein H6Q16_209 [Bacteroidetes bacterium]|nr:hypothetical protein [Bacteroidota bacterium]
MKTFAAIDFETANQHRSICSMGVVIVKNGIITDRFYSLVKPEPNFYCYWATECHGLTKKDTNNAEYFPEVWSNIVGRIKNLPLVAHNSQFDEGCLKANYDQFNMKYPYFQFYCTLRKARQVIPDLPNYQLDTVAEHLGFTLENHHNALADAEACAFIATKIL